LKERKNQKKPIFQIPKPRHVSYWMNQAYPVMLVVRASSGEIQWMEVREHLKELSANGTKRITQIQFSGERFDVMSVYNWRKKLQADKAPPTSQKTV